MLSVRYPVPLRDNPIHSQFPPSYQGSPSSCFPLSLQFMVHPSSEEETSASTYLLFPFLPTPSLFLFPPQTPSQYPLNKLYAQVFSVCLPPPQSSIHQGSFQGCIATNHDIGIRLGQALSVFPLFRGWLG